ncbi:hypothetical protein LTR62_004993 [Meristemomyces frigidus]|uniref:non-specific serine/threonine protein kinase n=1 Tax=Meristemomyces frigidus TaxID=1508187 RepID=A0AAN7YTI9_9PEZI|nr:hypothetical protein LTR62_004993 [Meristemomyces frigidus]
MAAARGPPAAVFSQDIEPTQCTQGAMDPRRLGRNNSGLSEADVADVMCILHPCSPAAFLIVAKTAERSPQHVLQNDGFAQYDDALTQSMLEEQETFILHTEGSNQVMDLALRFSTHVLNPTWGFVFGRDQRTCDIVLAQETHKRVSNMHFSIFVNESGVLMLQDMSTNGTMVDDIVLRGKISEQPQTRMLSPGSIIQILSPKSEEVVKFIVRIPAREGYEKQFEAKLGRYLKRTAHAHAVQARQENLAARGLEAREPYYETASPYKAPLMTRNHTYGMHWGGGEKYNVVGLIGKGAFATVYQLATKREGHLYAAKELEKRKFMKHGILDRKLDNEMQIMKAISHPNIVRYVDYQDHANHLYIIMEFVPCGDLQQYLGEQGALTESLGKTIAAQVLNSLAYLHAKKITHRDIKPDNILIANMDPNNFTVKLSDFGLSKVVTDNETFLKTFCGTLLYCAPEVFPHYDAHVAGRGQKRTRRGPSLPPTKYHIYSQAVDIWSFGAVLWFALCKLPPFEGVADQTGQGMFDKIMLTPLNHGDLLRQGTSKDAIDLLVAMLNTDPAARPSPRTCLSHKWFNNGVNPDRQLGAPNPPTLDMFAIDEEDEAELTADPDLSQLSLGEGEDSGPSSQDSHYADEASIHSGSMHFFDPRQSKRFKSEAFSYRNDGADLLDSSSALMDQTIPIMLQQDIVATEPPPASTPRKLFGEISQSAFADPVVLSSPGHKAFGEGEMMTGHSHVPVDRALPARQLATDESGAISAPSLLGAEALMQDVHMDSPQSADSQASRVNEPTTPQTPSMPNGSASGQAKGRSVAEDETPKQRQLPVFRRQIELPIPASLFWEPHDKSTHNAEYASKISGFDYSANKSYVFDAPRHPLPHLTSGSTIEHDEHDGDTDAEPDVKPEFDLKPQTTAPSMPPPARPLGRLTPTADSFYQRTLNLTDRVSHFGRLPANTHIYEDQKDTRVAKRAIIITFHHEKGDQYLAEGDWTALREKDLYCAIQTDSKHGIQVNGIWLYMGEQGTTNFGRVYTGDVVTAVLPSRNRHAGLVFTCEFFVGQGKASRKAGEPRFRLENRGSFPGVKVDEDKTSVKGKEKESVASVVSVA